MPPNVMQVMARTLALATHRLEQAMLRLEQAMLRLEQAMLRPELVFRTARTVKLELVGPHEALK